MKIQRRYLRWGLWLGILLALSLLPLFLGGVAFWAFRAPARVVSQVPIWGWAHWGQWDYTVWAKPNTVYGAQQLGPGLTYYDSLVERIEARFSYAFTADTPVRIEGWYMVTAMLKAGTMSELYEVVPRTPFLVEGDSSWTMEEALPIDRGFFRRRLEEVARETGTAIAGEATVTYTAQVEVAATAQGQSARQGLAPSLTVPLSGAAFTLSGSPSLSGNGVLRRLESLPRTSVERLRLYSLLAAGVALLPLVLFALAARPSPRREDPLARQARRLRRKYGKHIAQAGPGEAPTSQAIPLASMGDLARVSEELLKPILYSPPAQPGAPHRFFVVDGATCYQFCLSPSSTPAPGD